MKQYGRAFRGGAGGFSRAEDRSPLMAGYRSVLLYKIEEPGTLKKGPAMRSLRSIHSLSTNAKAGGPFRANQTTDELMQQSEGEAYSALGPASLNFSMAEHNTINLMNTANLRLRENSQFKYSEDRKRSDGRSNNIPISNHMNRVSTQMATSQQSSLHSLPKISVAAKDRMQQYQQNTDQSTQNNQSVIQSTAHLILDDEYATGETRPRINNNMSFEQAVNEKSYEGWPPKEQTALSTEGQYYEQTEPATRHNRMATQDYTKREPQNLLAYTDAGASSGMNAVEGTMTPQLHYSNAPRPNNAQTHNVSYEKYNSAQESYENLSPQRDVNIRNRNDDSKAMLRSLGQEASNQNLQEMNIKPSRQAAQIQTQAIIGLKNSNSTLFKSDDPYADHNEPLNQQTFNVAPSEMHSMSEGPQKEAFATLQNGHNDSVFDSRFDSAFKENFRKHGLKFSEPQSSAGTEFPRLRGAYSKYQRHSMQSIQSQQSMQAENINDIYEVNRSTQSINGRSEISFPHNKQQSLSVSRIDQQLTSFNSANKNHGFYSLTQPDENHIVQGKNLNAGFSVSKLIQGGLHSHHKLSSKPRYSAIRNKNMGYEQMYNHLVGKGRPPGVTYVATDKILQVEPPLQAGDRKTIIQLKNGDSHLKHLRQNKNKHHSVNAGVTTHVQKYRTALEQREQNIGAIIEREFHEFDDLDKIQRNMYAREKREALKAMGETEALKRSLKSKSMGDGHSTNIKANATPISQFKSTQFTQEQSKQGWANQSNSKRLQSTSIVNSDGSDQEIDEDVDAQQKIDDELDQLPSLDELDFDLRKEIQRCRKCADIKGQQAALDYKKDPKQYEFILKYRKLLKKDRIRAEDLQDDVCSLEVNVQNQAGRQNNQYKKLEQVDHLSDKQRSLALEEEIQLAAFREWQRYMWSQLKWHIKKWEEEARPNYVDKYYESAKELHMVPFFLEFKIRAYHESEVLEQMWKKPQGLAEFRKSLQYILKEDNIGKDQFIDHLIIVKEANDRQQFYFDQVKDLLFTSYKKTIIDKLNDNDIDLSYDDEEIGREKKFINELMHVRSRAVFLQQKVGQIFEPRNKEQTLDPEKEFAKQSHKQQGLAMPNVIWTPQRMDTAFVVIDKGLWAGQSKSLAGSFFVIEGTAVKQIYLSGNHLAGQQTGEFLRSLSDVQQNGLQSIVYGGRNEFTKETYEALKDCYLSKKAPHSLHELKLIDIRVRDQDALYNLVRDIHADLKLQSLCLAKANLDPRSVELVADCLAAKKPCLKHVDISWNKISIKHMRLICQSLKGNHFIQSLNLAFNPVSKACDLKPLENFIRQNANLQHLDLSGVLQTARQVQRAVKKLKKSQSLIAVHLSHTPCIKQDIGLQLYIQKKLNAINKIVPEEGIEAAQAAKYQNYRDPEEIAEKVDWKYKYDLILQAKAQQKEKEYFEKQLIPQPFSSHKKFNFVIQRCLAHNEIAGNKRWILNDDCYSCSRWQYTLFFVDKSSDTTIEGTFELLNSPSKGLKPVDIRVFARNLVENTGDPESDSLRYLDNLPKGDRDQLEGDAVAFAKYNYQFKEKDVQLYQNQDLWQKILSEKLLYDKYQALPTRPEDFNLAQRISALGYEEDPRLFVFADYMKPNRRVERLTIKRNTDKQVKREEYLVPEVRKVDLPKWRVPKRVKGLKEDGFDKDKSVFKPWLTDTPQIIRSALKFDLSYWRAPKFIKDIDDLHSVTRMITDNYERLKLMFTNLMSGGNYPHLGWNDFTAFCRQVEILDNTIPTSTVDRMFITTKVGCFSGASQTQLFRHEFLEILVRVANAKYRELGMADSYSEALRLLLDQFLPNYTPEPWQDFRSESLWCQDVNKLYTTNANQLQEVFSQVFPKYNTTGLKNCIDLMMRQSDVQLSDQETRFCYGMSKMTVRDEVGKHEDYEKLKYVEFLEFIGRVAHAKYSDDDETPIDVKIEHILDDVFPVYGLKRKVLGEEVDDDETSEESVFVEDEAVQAWIDKKGMRHQFVF